MRAEHGFTLIEVLIAMVLSLVVFGAVLDVLDTYTRQQQQATERLDAQDAARLGIDRIVRQLRNIASPITTPKLLERAMNNDIVFQTIGTAPNGSNATGAERVRYCITPPGPPYGPAGASSMIAETQTWTSAAPPDNPWSSSSPMPCPDATLPSDVTETSVAQDVVNSSSQPAFLFNNSATPPGSLGQIYTVQIDLFVNPTPSYANAETELRSDAFLRNQPRAPVAYFSPTPTGGGGVVLNGGQSYSPDGENLAYSWSCTSGCTATQASALSSAVNGLEDWAPGAGTYYVQLTVTDETGLTATYGPEEVTVN